MSYEISKLEAAERQLDTALKLYSQFGDEIATHTLASAARQVLCDICDAKEILPVSHPKYLVNSFIKPESHKQFWQKTCEARNFFKHAEKEPFGTLQFNPEQTEFVLFDCVDLFRTLTNHNTPIQRVFFSWFVVQHSDVLVLPDGVIAPEFPAKDRQFFFEKGEKLIPTELPLSIWGML